MFENAKKKLSKHRFHYSKMRVFLFAGAVSAVDWVPGVNPVNCGADYFRAGAEWPLESAANAGRTVR